MRKANTKTLPIAGTATLDQSGIFTTEVGARRFAVANMPRDLARAGFEAFVSIGEEVHSGRYRECWRISYGKQCGTRGYA